MPAAVGPGVLGAARRYEFGRGLGRRNDSRDVWRVRPHAADQQERRPRPLGCCQSAVLAGGGIRGGQLFGSSDAQAAYPRDDAVSPADIVATIYHAMGLSGEREIHDREGRPYRLTDGRPLANLFAEFAVIGELNTLSVHRRTVTIVFPMSRSGTSHILLWDASCADLLHPCVWRGHDMKATRRNSLMV